MINVSIDYETEAIESRPVYPPKPVGCAIYIDGGTPRYLAWGHPTENNTTFEQARIIIKSVLDDPEHNIICHNLPFDAAVTIEKMGLDFPWDRCGDTMLLAFLADPFGDLSLKPLCEQLLGLPPDERDAVKEWLIRNGVCRDSKGWGAYISKAPGELVGTYAEGDVTRTIALFNKLYPQIVDAGMDQAYINELALMPHIMAMEKRGVNLDHVALAADTDFYFEKLEWLDEECVRALATPIDPDTVASPAARHQNVRGCLDPTARTRAVLGRPVVTPAGCARIRLSPRAPGRPCAPPR